ncbi:hypothetical protein A3Q56_06723, partial [Intoshia linei]
MTNLPENEKIRAIKHYNSGFIFSEEPYAYIVNDEYIGKVCSECFKVKSLQVCENCKLVYYCSNECAMTKCYKTTANYFWDGELEKHYYFTCECQLCSDPYK